MFEHPHTLSLAVMLAGRDHKAGMLLYRISQVERFAKATIPDKEGTWIAHDREWWARDAWLTLRQCDRALAKLERRGLIERDQWYWQNRLILYVRVTQLVRRVLECQSMTWELAKVLGADIDQFAKNGKPGLPELANLVCQKCETHEFAKNGKPASPKTANPNIQNNKQGNTKDQQDAASLFSEKKIPEENKQSTVSNLSYKKAKPKGHVSATPEELLAIFKNDQ